MIPQTRRRGMCKYISCTMNSRWRQSGAVLFVALIALVALALAAVALVRSVDTNMIVSGNIAFKQSATLSGDSGTETAIAWLRAEFDADQTKLHNHDAGKGYYATNSTSEFDIDNSSHWTTDNKYGVASGDSINNEGVESATGNQIRYVIQRMCSEDGEPTEAICINAPGGLSNSSSKGVSATPPLTGTSNPLSPLYRVTVRVTGPRNTVSFIQAFVY